MTGRWWLFPIAVALVLWVPGEVPPLRARLRVMGRVFLGLTGTLLYILWLWDAILSTYPPLP